VPVINIDSSAIVAHAAKLERLRKSALPVAIRQTLNAAALYVKQVSMPDESSRAFHKRKPTFFGATSSVDFAKGLEISGMRSTVGFIAPGNAKESGHATRDLEQQEHGGDIDKRAFIATDKGRTGKGNVKDALTMAKIKPHIIDASKEYGKNDQERFIKAAIKAGVSSVSGQYVIGTGKNSRGNRALLKIISLHKSDRGQERGKYGEDKQQQWKGGMIVKSEEVYSVHAHRKAHVAATGFMHKASDTAAKEMNRIFIEKANIQLSK